MIKTELVENRAFPIIKNDLVINGQIFRVLQQGQGAAVLLCHGFPDTAETWSEQMNALAQAGYRAIAMDMRGFGGSYAPSDFNLYSAHHIVSDLIGVLNSLRVDAAFLVGHDWGADHAQKAMLMYPERFKALVTISIPFVPRGEISYWDHLRQNGLGNKYYAFAMMENNSELIYKPARETISKILYWLSGSPQEGNGWNPIDRNFHMMRSAPVEVPSWANPNYFKRTVDWFGKTGFQTGVNHYRGMQVTFEETAELKGKLITQPSLYIWGKKDGLSRFFHPQISTVEELRKTLPGLKKQIALDDVGHWPQLEAADTVSKEIINFFDDFRN